MDLTSILLRAGAQRPHVLVVPVVGAATVRLSIEASLARRGWPAATSPADADIVVMAGTPGPELADVIEQVWRRVPMPRARATVSVPDDVDGQLDQAVSQLSDFRKPVRDRADPLRTAHSVAGPRPEAAGGDGHARHENDGGSEVHGGHHAHHGHRGGMEMPGGLPMADLGEDRDGLTLDRLHVPLGPVLPDWPAGLVVRATLQGDVIQEATAQVLGGADDHLSTWSDADVAVRELDALARFLGVAGWADAAARSRRLRDVLLTGDRADGVVASAVALVRRVRRSRTLRWLIRGVAVGEADLAGLLEQRLAVIDAAIAGIEGQRVARPSVEELANLLVGTELAVARLIVAALDPDTERASVGDRERHG